MNTGVVEQVKQDAARAVRNLPDAHAAWQFFWRDAAFRRAVGNVEKALYALNVDKFSDEQLHLLEQIVRIVIKIVEVHVAGLGTAVRETVDREYFRRIIGSLEIAADGLEQGLSPDPQKRPTDDQLLDRFADMLNQQPISLPDRTDCAPGGTS
jgi:hypothetical protein